MGLGILGVSFILHMITAYDESLPHSGLWLIEAKGRQSDLAKVAGRARPEQNGFWTIPHLRL